jgi:hypothetical protein
MDSSDIDQAIIAKLGADATLLALTPNGVYWDEAPQGSTRFVIVSLITEFDEAVFDTGRAIEDALYLVEARMLSTVPGANIKAAAARIDALLEDGVITVNGYTQMVMHREERVRLTEVDDIDSSIRWLRRGGRYRVQMSVGT